jgi:hypothetical protein
MLWRSCGADLYRVLKNFETLENQDDRRTGNIFLQVKNINYQITRTNQHGDPYAISTRLRKNITPHG